MVNPVLGINYASWLSTESEFLAYTILINALSDWFKSYMIHYEKSRVFEDLVTAISTE